MNGENRRADVGHAVAKREARFGRLWRAEGATGGGQAFGGAEGGAVVRAQAEHAQRGVGAEAPQEVVVRGVGADARLKTFAELTGKVVPTDAPEVVDEVETLAAILALD